MRNYEGIEVAAMQMFNPSIEFTNETYQSKIKNPEEITINKNLEEHMSYDGRIFFKYIIDIPADAVDQLKSSGKKEYLAAVIIKYLNKKQGWTIKRARNAMQEVKECLYACI